MKFSNIGPLKRDRELEGVIGMPLKLTDEIYLTCLCASDANPRWTDKSQKAFDELGRLRNAGAPDARIERRFAELFAETIVTEWYGGLDDDMAKKPGGPKDENDNLVTFSREACVEFLLQADDAISAIIGLVMDTKKFRDRRAVAIVERAKNV